MKPRVPIASTVAGFALALAVAAQVATAAGENVVQAGAGGYRLGRPEPCKPLPEMVHKTKNFKKPVITGQWWSSLLWQKREFSQPLFAHPLAATCTGTGLTVRYPGSHIHGINKTGVTSDYPILWTRQ